MASNNDNHKKASEKTEEKTNFPRARDWVPSFNDETPDWAKDSKWSSTVKTLLTVVFGTEITEQQQVIFKPKIEALANELYVEWFKTGHHFIGLEFVKYQILAWFWMELGHTQEELDAMNLAIPVSYMRDADLGYMEFLMAEHPEFYHANKWRMPVFRPPVKSGPSASNAAQSAPTTTPAAPSASKAAKTSPAVTPETVNSPASKAVKPNSFPTTNMAAAFASKATTPITSTAASKAAVPPLIGPKRESFATGIQACQNQLNFSTAESSTTPQSQAQAQVSGINKLIEAGRADRGEHFISCGLSANSLEFDGYPFEARLPNNVHKDKAMATRLFKDPNVMRQVSTMLDSRLRIVWTEHNRATFLLAIPTSNHTKLDDVDYLSVWEILVTYCGMLETNPGSLIPLSDWFRHSLETNALRNVEKAKVAMAERKRRLLELELRKQEDAAKSALGQIKSKQTRSVMEWTIQRCMETKGADGERWKRLTDLWMYASLIWNNTGVHLSSEEIKYAIQQAWSNYNGDGKKAENTAHAARWFLKVGDLSKKFLDEVGSVADVLKEMNMDESVPGLDMADDELPNDV
ncbi:hypothetical protein CkaCkLH20_09453 [Colletotrichum karsti]|uniref:Uncharacterized protein n=1 Tax=Colletotrichum karsti TaxID=1095194 RepID=A0A9P6HY23_9PEZI|nr:uncharacterized protein CkaCkLH20_09453 [Colletotrichum karsti]KAF9872943.1 hypothetical protein CkaCkLH20_09453 [Colletotrichum karsti]